MKYSSVFQCAHQVAKEEGISSFWRGSMCSFMKVLLPPAACLILEHPILCIMPNARRGCSIVLHELRQMHVSA